ncbi:MAG TPA: glycosyltransferase family 2 protein [Steroidobacteraceae bacterium]|nr:glycosyltransferase family 2 protein [Steroidobacteraceae bacterium]
MRTTIAAPVSVCLATFKRNERLGAVLADLARQDRVPDQVVVVDNDPAAGARATVAQFRASGVPFRVDYDVQPLPNIAITRNRSVQLASGSWIAFLDDDERAPAHWLRELMLAVEAHGADAVLAPVEPQVPENASAWIRRGRFYDFPHQREGAEVPLNCMRFGNVVLRADLLHAEDGPFDPRHGLMAGEDLDLLVRLAHKGAKVVWTEKAPVYEAVEPKRLSLRFLTLRALGAGQGFARYTLAGGFRSIGWPGRALFFLQAAAQMLIAGALSLLSLPFGRHHAAHWLIRTSANFGKLSVLWGGSYHAYGRNAGPVK